MTCYPILNIGSLILASLALAVVAWAGVRLLRQWLSPICRWGICLVGIVTVTLVALRCTYAWLPAPSYSMPTFLTPWLAPAANGALILLALTSLWLAQRAVRRGRELDATLVETQRRSEMLLNRLPDLVFSLDTTGRFITVNAASRTLLGYEPAEMIGKPFTGFIARQMLDETQRAWNEYTRSPGTRSGMLQVTLIARGGEAVPTLISLSVRRDANDQFAGVDAIARDNRAQLAYEQRMREHANKMENLFSLSLAMSSSLDLNDLLQRLLDIIQDAIGYDSASVFVNENGNYRALAQRGYPDPIAIAKVPYQVVAAAQLEIMHQTRYPLVVADTAIAEGWRPAEGAEYIRSWLGAPLFVRDEMVGVINLDCRRPDRYGAEDAQLLATIAAQAAAAIHNAYLFRRVQEQAERLGRLTPRLLTLQATSITLAQASSVTQALVAVRRAVSDLFENTLPAIFVLVDEGARTGELIRLDETDEYYWALCEAAGFPIAGRRFLLADLASAQWHPLNRRPLVLERLSDLISQLAPVEVVERLQREFGVSALAILPMWSRDRLIGFIVLSRQQAFTDQDIEVLLALTNIVAVALDNLQLLEDLRRTSGELDSVIASSMDAIVAINREAQILVWNAAAERVFDAPAQEMVGRTLEATLRPDIAPFVRSLARRVIAGEQVTLNEQEFMRRDGRRIWLSGHVTPMTDANQAITGALFIVHDVTQERAAKRQLQQTEKLSAMGQLAAGVAHELNNPLTSIIGYAQLLRNTSADAQMQSDLDRIIRQGKRAARIVQNLLTFVGEHEPRRVLTDINDVLRSALEIRQYELAGGNITVETDFAPDLPVTLADYHQLQQVFFNLILNAEQAMSEAHNGGRLTVRTRLLKGNTIRIEVRDNGPGIAAENLSRIFDPFFTTKTVGKGTGLGLSICYGIIEEHGGHIWVESELGQGATFLIELPVVEAKRKAPVTS